MSYNIQSHIDFLAFFQEIINMSNIEIILVFVNKEYVNAQKSVKQLGHCKGFGGYCLSEWQTTTFQETIWNLFS